MHHQFFWLSLRSLTLTAFWFPKCSLHMDFCSGIPCRSCDVAHKRVRQCKGRVCYVKWEVYEHVEHAHECCCLPGTPDLTFVGKRSVSISMSTFRVSAGEIVSYPTILSRVVIGTGLWRKLCSMARVSAASLPWSVGRGGDCSFLETSLFRKGVKATTMKLERESLQSSQIFRSFSHSLPVVTW